MKMIIFKMHKIKEEKAVKLMTKKERIFFKE
jgi:hypothetical protein